MEEAHDHGHGDGHDHADLIDRPDAVERVLDRREEVLSDRPTREVELDRIAGHTLATDVVADEDRPAFDHSTMDGFAFDATDDYPLDLVDVTYPEDDPPSIQPGQAVRITTGAALPPEANAVLKKEEASVEDGQLRGAEIDPGTYVYRKASNVAAGEVLFEAGERLSPKDAILLGDLGRESVEVHDPLRVGVLASGTEIHEGRHPDLDSPMLAGLVRSWGAAATYEGTVPDDRDRVRDRIADLAGEYDVVVTTGGTSVGKKDYVVRSLHDLGQVDFHRVAVRPGKPIAMARLDDATVFAIPGKPVGAHTIASLVMGPFFTGERTLPTVPSTLEAGFDTGPEGFEYVIPVTMDPADGNVPSSAMPLGHADSLLQVYDRTFDPSVLSSSTRATRADGFVITESGHEAGERVRVVPYPVVE